MNIFYESLKRKQINVLSVFFLFCKDYEKKEKKIHRLVAKLGHLIIYIVLFVYDTGMPLLSLFHYSHPPAILSSL